MYNITPTLATNGIDIGIVIIIILWNTMESTGKMPMGRYSLISQPTEADLGKGIVFEIFHSEGNFVFVNT